MHSQKELRSARRTNDPNRRKQVASCLTRAPRELLRSDIGAPHLRHPPPPPCSHLLQVLHRWQRHGYGHVLLVNPTAEPCRRLEAGGAFHPLLGCGWFEDRKRVGWIVDQKGGCK